MNIYIYILLYQHWTYYFTWVVLEPAYSSIIGQSWFVCIIAKNSVSELIAQRTYKLKSTFVRTFRVKSYSFMERKSTSPLAHRNDCTCIYPFGISVAVGQWGSPHLKEDFSVSQDIFLLFHVFVFRSSLSSLQEATSDDLVFVSAHHCSPYLFLVSCTIQHGGLVQYHSGVMSTFGYFAAR